MAKKKLYKRVGISWKNMKIGKVLYKGTYDGAKANVCRANHTYKPKKWRTFSNEDGVFIERLE